MIGLTDFNQLDLNPTSTHQHTEGDFMQEVVHVVQVGDDGDAGGDGDGDGGGDSDEDGGTGEELHQQQGQREEQEPMQEVQAQEHMQEEHKQEPQEQAQNIHRCRVGYGFEMSMSGINFFTCWFLSPC
jgi:hypothetical protein